jgi:hypothetical protein
LPSKNLSSKARQTILSQEILPILDIEYDLEGVWIRKSSLRPTHLASKEVIQPGFGMPLLTD